MGRESIVAEISLTGDQMLTVLNLVAEEGPLSAADVARACNMNSTVAHRLLNTLELRAFLRRSHTGYPRMDKLAERIGETVVLHCIDKDQAVVVQQSLGNRHLVRVQHTPGSRHPLYLGASGWSLLAFQDEKIITRILKRAPAPEESRERIELIRSSRYAVSHNELQLDVHGISAPLFDEMEHCVASIAILVPAMRAENITSLAPLLLETAAVISNDLQESAV
jgi:DNA-binding IclR family transcriptional regulator